MTLYNLILLLILNTLLISFLIKIYNLMCNYNYKEYLVYSNFLIYDDIEICTTSPGVVYEILNSSIYYI